MRVTELRKNLFKVLDRVAETGVPVEIERNGKRLRIISIDPTDKFATAKFFPDCIIGDPDELEAIDWSREWKA